MILGDKNRIDLGTSSFTSIRRNNNLYIDKTKLIENFLTEANSVQLIVRQRRSGKSLNLDMLKLFLTDKENNMDLFRSTYIEHSVVWDLINSVPVFLFNFKNLRRKCYKEQIWGQVLEHIYNYLDADNLKGIDKIKFDRYVEDKGENPEGLLLLTSLVYSQTGKESYILIDEYDKLLTDNYNHEDYESIKEYETTFLSAGLKGNNFLKKALLTGVMRISRESLLSGLNNLSTYDVFNDALFTNDFGLTDLEIDELQKYFSFDKQEIKQWYNGIRINGQEIYTIYSVLSYLKYNRYDNFWGRSGTIEIIISMLNNSRRADITKLLNGSLIQTPISKRISLSELKTNPGDGLFYSLLVQSGYLSLMALDSETNKASLAIPNRELMNVWKEFILSSVITDSGKIRTIFDNIENLDLFSDDIRYFLSDRLSYFDLAEDNEKTKEQIYHVFVLGLLSAYEDISYSKPPISNRESGDGRYDILVERKNYSIIFEFKSVPDTNQLEFAAKEALRQIDEKRYYADAPKDKPLIKTAIAFYKKQCAVKSSSHQW